MKGTITRDETIEQEEVQIYCDECEDDGEEVSTAYLSLERQPDGTFTADREIHICEGCKTLFDKSDAEIDLGTVTRDNIANKDISPAPPDLYTEYGDKTMIGLVGFGTVSAIFLTEPLFYRLTGRVPRSQAPRYFTIATFILCLMTVGYLL